MADFFRGCFQGTAFDIYLHDGILEPRLLEPLSNKDSYTAQYTRIYYIEAVAGATFSLEVILDPEFDIEDLGNWDGVKVTVKINGSDRDARISLLNELQLNFDLLESVTFNFDTAMTINLETEALTRDHYEFLNFGLST